MKHHALLKFKEGSNKQELYEKIKKVYAQIAEELDFLSDVKVHCNCYERTCNYDVMMELIVPKERLLEYLEYPLHVQLGKELSHAVEGMIAFDFE